MKKILCVGLVILFLTIATNVAADVVGERRTFFVDQSYDFSGREEVRGILVKVSSKLYFYIDEDWWNSNSQSEIRRVLDNLDNLGQEFDQKIYPVLTNNFGFEWKPGIDGEEKITVLIHPMREGARGYFNSGDEYLKIENPKSNEREMLYINADYITTSLAKSFLAHEFVHLITFNQKEKIQGVEEEVWLNEARAEYASTLLGYDVDYEGSNLERRVRTFLENPSDSITEWRGSKADYGALNLFIQYLVEQYGIDILIDSLKLNKTGIESINYALKKNGFEQDFAQIFTDWTITVLVNDCSLGKKYCYKNDNLKNLQIIPSLNFLPLNGKSTLGVSQTGKNWAGNWFKFIGGGGTLKIEFIGNPNNLFKIPYVIKDYSNNYSLEFFSLNKEQRGEVFVSGLGTTINSIIIIPSIQTKISEFSENDPAVSYFWSVSVLRGEEKPIPKYLEKPIAQMSRSEILFKIEEIENLLNQLKIQLTALDKPESTNEDKISCQKFEEHLYYGIMNSDKVKCLQEFLKSQGSDIYPEGLVTGNFLSLTKQAVIRFQERYAEEILKPWGLTQGTGFVGKTTIAKINELLRQ